MQKSILKLDKVSENCYHTIFQNNHGRRIYIRLICENDEYLFTDCFYTDRPERNGTKAVPLRFHTLRCKQDDLLIVVASELDKHFFGVEFSDSENNMSAKEYIKQKSQDKRKYKFLILVNSGNVYKTRIKNRIHRSIRLEINRTGSKGVITDCRYYDRRYKRNQLYITPSGLTSNIFDFDMDNILKIVNNELNCDFTDVIITKDRFGFDATTLPICGSI
uniref:Uncharacterized protein n=1 Tax=uncultured Bacillota bacterium TaxID=344338 RepID=A0A650EMJ7_9FIRM|nr:hypothetical protein Firmicute1046_1430 [uncultured Firmicutes bacterium]